MFKLIKKSLKDISDEAVYEHFLPCGPIDYVRIIRDNKTGIGKGFGYVQFKTSDTVALGLKLDGSTVNERKIRVNRCVKKQVYNMFWEYSELFAWYWILFFFFYKKKPKKETAVSDKNSKNGKFNKNARQPHAPDNRNPKKFRARNESSDVSRPKKSFASDDKAKKSNKNKKKKSFKKRHISTNSKNRIKFNI